MASFPTSQAQHSSDGAVRSNNDDMAIIDGARALGENDESKALQGRRKKAAKMAQKKQKPGSFGTRPTRAPRIYLINLGRAYGNAVPRGAARHAVVVLINLVSHKRCVQTHGHPIAHLGAGIQR